MLGAAGLRAGRALAEARADGVAALRDDVFRISVGQSSVVALTGREGVALVNGGAASESAGLIEAVADLPNGGEVRTLFNTCWHPEHTGSNEVLGRAGATIIAHENTRLWLTQHITWPWDGRRFDPLPEAARPNKTFYGREHLTLAGREIEYGHVRASPHTDGDCYVLFRDANVLAVGDAVAGSGWPMIDYWTGGWIGGVVGGLESLLVIANEETQIVPASGPVLRRADLQNQYDMFAKIYERLAEHLNRGHGPEETLAARPTQEFDAKMGPSDEFVVRAFKSLWGYLAPDA